MIIEFTLYHFVLLFLPIMTAWDSASFSFHEAMKSERYDRCFFDLCLLALNTEFLVIDKYSGFPFFPYLVLFLWHN